MKMQDSVSSSIIDTTPIYARILFLHLDIRRSFLAYYPDSFTPLLILRSSVGDVEEIIKDYDPNFSHVYSM